MREYWIETEPVRFLSIYDMRITIGINQHGSAEIKGYIADEWKEEYLARLMQEMCVSVIAVDKEENRKRIFCGYVKNFKINKMLGQTSLCLNLISASFFMDINSHTRLFQDGSMSYGNVFEQICEINKGNFQIADLSLDEPLDELVVQYKETDWDFLIRLMSRSQCYIVPEVREKKLYLSAGLNAGRELELRKSKSFSFEKNIDEYMLKVSRGIELTENDSIICYICDRELYYLGDYIVWQGIKMYVSEIDIQYVNGEIINKYTARTKGGLIPLVMFQDKIRGCSLMGEVVGVKEDKVQVNIEEDENTEEINRKWFSFSTPYSSKNGVGWYFMPDIGDTIRLYFPNKVENNAYVISAVHKGGTEGRDRPEHKILKNKEQKEIRFTPDMILITNNKGMEIGMVDDEGIYIKSDKKISIESKEDLNIISQNGSLVLAADSSMTLSQGETCIQLEDGIEFLGGEFHVQ